MLFCPVILVIILAAKTGLSCGKFTFPLVQIQLQYSFCVVVPNSASLMCKNVTHMVVCLWLTHMVVVCVRRLTHMVSHGGGLCTDDTPGGLCMAD